MGSEETRKCRVCGLTKPITEFNKNGSTYRTDCIECKKIYAHSQYEKNKEQISKKHRKYYAEHAEQYRQWRATNKEYLKEQNKKWYQDNLEHVKAYREANKERINEKAKEYREKNKERLGQQRKEYYAKRPHYHRDYDRRRMAKDPLFRLKKQIRNAIRSSLYRKKYSKIWCTEDIIGCSYEKLWTYLKATWRHNYGSEWNGEPYHIDHIVPLSTATNRRELLDLSHYSNLQMLTPEDNMEKRDRLDWVLGE